MLKVDGQPVNNLRDLVAAVAASQGQYLSLDLEYNQVRVVFFGVNDLPTPFIISGLGLLLCLALDLEYNQVPEKQRST